ncbi:MAG: HEAT repeat domain-containing protein [Methylococcales bacterium]
MPNIKPGETDMSLKIVPPFDFVPRISDAVNVDTDKLSLKRLRDVVSGKDTTFPRSRGMAMLLTTDFPNKERDFEAVLENEKESPDIRYLAAINLSKIPSPATIEILVKNCHVRDERVLAGVMKALGSIGNKSALDAILMAKKRAKGLAAMQAEFATTLITHREGLEGYELTAPETANQLEPDLHCARPFRITRADDADAEFCLRSLAGQPFGIEFSEHPMYQVRCGRNTWMILFNRDFGGKSNVKTLGKRKAFLGVVAIRSEETRLYSVAYLLLTSPAKDEDAVSILVYRTNGKLTFAGTARVVGNCADFSILALPQPGAFAVKIEGTFEDGRLNIKTALSTTLVQIKKREPTEELGAQVGGEEVEVERCS